MRTGPKPRQLDQIPGCAVPGCDRKAVRKGMCDTHYRRLSRGIPLDQPLRVYRYDGACAADGCERRPIAGGLCSAHWQRQRNSLPLGPLREVGIPNRVVLYGETAWIILTGQRGEEVARTAIDLADLDVARAHRWRAHRGGRKNAQVYATSHTAGFLHGFLVGQAPGMEPDHIDRDGLNNRRCNLRNVTSAVNAQNKGEAGRRGRKYDLPRGVYANGDRGYKVQVGANGKQHYGGTFRTIADAATAAIAIRAKLHIDDIAPPTW